MEYYNFICRLWEDPIQPENIESSDNQGFVLPEQMVPSVLSLEGLPFLCFTEEINFLVSVKLALTFYKEMPGKIIFKFLKFLKTH